MTDTDAVAAALARLANGAAGAPAADTSAAEFSAQASSEVSTTGKSAQPPPDVVVREAQCALTRLRTAAAFVDDDGRQRLARAVSEAERDGAQAVVEQGEALLAAMNRFQTAAHRGATPADPQGTAVHFHRGHGTLLAGDGVEPER